MSKLALLVLLVVNTVIAGVLNFGLGLRLFPVPLELRDEQYSTFWLKLQFFQIDLLLLMIIGVLAVGARFFFQSHTPKE